MGTQELKCPLCCNQMFSDHDSLKEHLLSIKLSCNICKSIFDRVNDLAMHIGRQCADKQGKSNRNNIANTDVNLKTNGTNNGNSENVLVKLGESTGTSKENALDSIKLDLEEVTQDAIDEEETALNNSDSLYYCSSCAINFTNIDEHLEKFHQGHQVFLESDKLEDDDQELPNNSVFILEDNDKEDECDAEDAMSASDLLDTIQEEEVVDKEGRLYTRKLVKIEKFWNDANNTVLKSEDIEIYRCPKCMLTFNEIQQFNQHKCDVKMAPLDNSTFRKCSICNTCFADEFYLSMHMKTHKTKDSLARKKSPVDSDATYPCEICNTEFNTYKSLRLHKRMHEPIKAKDVEPPVNYVLLGEEFVPEKAAREMFQCEICHKLYDKEYEEAHKQCHSNNVDFNCETCNRKFYSQENLEMHMRAHVDSKKFVCVHCKKRFLTKEKLDAHMLTKCQTRQYECQYCGRRFARPHEKVKHERIHTGEKPHICTICGKAFRVSYCLTLHMRTHSGTRPYKCQICGKRFKAHSVFNHHLLTHSEDRKYKCPYCPKAFKTGVQLAGHKNSHIKPFTCKKCQRPFASLYAARAHMETHDRQNNLKFDCQLCGASYARAFALRDHLREHHGTVETKTTIINQSAHENLIAEGDNILIDMDNETVENMEV